MGDWFCDRFGNFYRLLVSRDRYGDVPLPDRGETTRDRSLDRGRIRIRLEREFDRFTIGYKSEQLHSRLLTSLVYFRCY